MLSWFRRTPTIPLLIINRTTNQAKARQLLQKLQRIDLSRSPAIGVVVQTNNYMPVQIQKIREYLLAAREKHGLKLYGFCRGNVSLESYYLLSPSDKVYALPWSVLQLRKGYEGYDTQGALGLVGMGKTTTKSDQDVVGRNWDRLAFAQTSNPLAIANVNERLYQRAIQSRSDGRAELKLPVQAPSSLLGQEAMSRGWVDGMASYYSVLKGAYPSHYIEYVKLREGYSTGLIQLLVTSPIILFLFLLKVLLKYTIIMYLYIRYNAKQRAQLEQLQNQTQ